MVGVVHSVVSRLVQVSELACWPEIQESCPEFHLALSFIWHCDAVSWLVLGHLSTALIPCVVLVVMDDLVHCAHCVDGSNECQSWYNW